MNPMKEKSLLSYVSNHTNIITQQIGYFTQNAYMKLNGTPDMMIDMHFI